MMSVEATVVLGKMTKNLHQCSRTVTHYLCLTWFHVTVCKQNITVPSE